MPSPEFDQLSPEVLFNPRKTILTTGILLLAIAAMIVSPFFFEEDKEDAQQNLTPTPQQNFQPTPEVELLKNTPPGFKSI